ncbi:type I-E CRISPR-associated endonuclease Cas1 [Micrococcales bacterium 31B]|nr:type I-E CRISPR-associated endonuclease Cas1 [Micrococcales bacterium 31B]
MTIPGARPPAPRDLVRAGDRLSFVYVERSRISRDSNALTVTDERGTIHVPVANLGAILLGPGTTVTHQAMTIIAESGATAIWVGEEGVRYYAHGSSLARSTRLLECQAARVSNQRDRLAVARAMYEMRFPGEETSTLSMQQLRGKEGARVRRIYREQARLTGVEWSGRDYDAEAFDSGSPVNQALSAANSALYGVVHAAIVALGCAPGLGFVHTGHYRSFVYDIADLYKAEVTIPLAFRLAAETDAAAPIGRRARIGVRDQIHKGGLIGRCVADIKQLLVGDVEVDESYNADVLYLWDGADRLAAGGTNYANGEADW